MTERRRINPATREKTTTPSDIFLWVSRVLFSEHYSIMARSET